MGYKLERELKSAVIQNCNSKHLRYALREDDMTLHKILLKAAETSKTQVKETESSTAQSSVHPSESVKYICKNQHTLAGQHRVALNQNQVSVANVVTFHLKKNVSADFNKLEHQEIIEKAEQATP